MSLLSERSGLLLLLIVVVKLVLGANKVHFLFPSELSAHLFR